MNNIINSIIFLILGFKLFEENDCKFQKSVEIIC
jgi:hypothetical protein